VIDAKNMHYALCYLHKDLQSRLSRNVHKPMRNLIYSGVQNRLRNVLLGRFRHVIKRMGKRGNP